MADTTATPTQPRKIFLFDIPELTAEVAQHLSFYQYTQCTLVSKTFYKAFYPFLWKDFEPPIDAPFIDPSLIRRNLSFIKNLTLSVLDHDLLPIFMDNLVPAVVSPSLFFREKLPLSTIAKEGDKTEEALLDTLLPSVGTLSTAIDNLYLDNQSRLTNLTTLTLLEAGLYLTPKEHLGFHSNILNLILQNPNINALRILADVLSLHPKLFFDILEHRLPRLERLELGSTASKAYTYSPSSALDNADLGLDNENFAMVAKFSGKITWETTVQLLETCLWKRQRNKANSSLTYLRCRYTICDDLKTIPESVLQSQLAHLRFPSSSSEQYEDQVDKAYEPRLRYLGLPCWGQEGSSFWLYESGGRYYPDRLLLPLLKKLPYVVRFPPY